MSLTLGNLGAAAATSISVSGLASFGTLTTSGAAALDSLGVANACTVGGTLDVTGLATRASASIVTLTGAAMTGKTSSIAKKQGTISFITSTAPGFQALWDGNLVIKGLVC